MNSQKQTHWGEVAEWYDDKVGQEGSEFHQKVIFPALLRLLRKQTSSSTSKRILDIGCGQGVLCRKLALLGHQVTGLDASQDLISYAMKRDNPDYPVTYITKDATTLVDEDSTFFREVQEQSFDAITIVLAIQNMASLSPVWQAVKKLLKPGGYLYVVMMHPSFRIPQHSDWQFNAMMQRQERVIWSYLTSQTMEIITHPGKVASGKLSTNTWHFHRPLQAYINTLGNHGLLLEHMEELVSHKKEQEGKKSEALNRAREEFPMFLLLQVRKV